LTLSIRWLRLSSQFVGRELHGHEAAVRSYNAPLDMQCKWVNIAEEGRPLDDDSDRSAGRHLVCARYQHAVAADVNRPAFTLYLLSSKDGVTGSKLDGEANPRAAFGSPEDAQAVWHG